MKTTQIAHTDVVCPPNPDALCVCGAPLSSHEGPNTFMRLCPTNPRQLWFSLADGEYFDCNSMSICDVCQTDICEEHSTELESCAVSGIHHRDCARECAECDGARRDDYASDRAAAMRKGEF